MARKKSLYQHAVQGLAQSDGFTHLLASLETEAERLVRRLLEKVGHSSEEFKKTLPTLQKRLLTALSIPTEQDLKRLSRKIVQLEQRVQKI